MDLSSYDSFYVRAGMRYNLTAKTCEGLYCRKLVANESEIVIVSTFAKADKSPGIYAENARITNSRLLCKKSKINGLLQVKSDVN